MQATAARLARASFALILLVQASVVRSAEPVVLTADKPGLACCRTETAAGTLPVVCPFSSRNPERVLQGRPLRQLDLQGRRVSDEACRLIATCDELTELQLAGCFLSDRGVAALSELKALRRLDLRGTPVSDVALDHLAELVSLNSLDLRGTRVSAEAVFRLQARRQKLHILFDRNPGCQLANARLLQAAPAWLPGR